MMKYEECADVCMAEVTDFYRCGEADDFIEKVRTCIWDELTDERTTAEDVELFFGRGELNMRTVAALDYCVRDYIEHPYDTMKAFKVERWPMGMNDIQKVAEAVCWHIVWKYAIKEAKEYRVEDDGTVFVRVYGHYNGEEKPKMKQEALDAFKKYGMVLVDEDTYEELKGVQEEIVC